LIYGHSPASKEWRFTYNKTNTNSQVMIVCVGLTAYAYIKFILAPVFYNTCLTLAGAPNYIGEGACYLIYPNASNDPPPGWENASEYIVNVY
jgi:hypothetical protein